MSTPRPMRLWAFRVLAVGLALVASLLLVEVALRAGGLDPEAIQGRDMVDFTPSLHHRLRPNARTQHRSAEFHYLWVNNSLGMRDRERPLRKPPGTFRIVFLGDSMVQGHGVAQDQTLPALLEASLNRPPCVLQVEVLNGGVFGYGPFLEWLYLKEILSSLEPDLVMVGFSLANDVGDDYFYTAKAHFDAAGGVTFADREWPWSQIVQALNEQEPSGDPKGAGSSPRRLGASLWPGVKRILKKSRLITYAKVTWDRIAANRHYRERRQREFDLVTQRLGDIEYNLGLVNYQNTDPAARAKYWDLSKRYLRSIVELCRSHHVALVLVAIPPAERLLEETTFDEPYRILDAFGKEASVPVIQLLPGFQSRKERLYYEYDRHWTPEGNRAAAAIIDAQLRALGILPEESR